MAVTFFPEVWTGAQTVLLSWSSDLTSPTFRVFVDGELVSTQTGTNFPLYVGAGVPVVEVLDDPAAVPQSAFPSRLVLGWAADSDAAQYRVQEFSGGAWVTRATLENSDAWMQYTTSVLADCTAAQWRVVPVDAAGNVGTATEFSALMVRFPDPPAQNLSYDAQSGTVTVAA